MCYERVQSAISVYESAMSMYNSIMSVYDLL